MGAADILDTTLDRTIALGYGNVGLAVRRRLPGWPADPPRIDGKVVMVTGRFWHDRRPRPTHYLIGAGEDSEADRRGLWTYCEALVDARRGDGSTTSRGSARRNPVTWGRHVTDEEYRAATAS